MKKKSAYLKISCATMIMLNMITPAAFAYEEVVPLSEKEFALRIVKNPLSQLRYDEKTFELAYKTFLFGNNPNDAFAIAYAAVLQKPGSTKWRERLAQTAIWTGRPAIALTQYDYLIQKAGLVTYLPQATKLAKSMGYYGQLITLLKTQYRQNKNDQLLVDLALAYNAYGEPLQGISLLHRTYQISPALPLLQAEVLIRQEMGDSQNELKVLQKIKKDYRVYVKDGLTESKIYYLRGNLNQALRVLKNVPQQHTITNEEYWRTKALLGWLTSDYSTTRQAYLRLLTSGQLSAEDLRRLLLLQPETATQQSLRIALLGWKKFHNPYAFLRGIFWARQLKDWRYIEKLYRMPAPAAALTAIQKEPDYWLVYASLFEHYRQYEKARLFLLRSVITHPNQPTLPTIYMDFLTRQLTLSLPDQNPDYLFAAVVYWKDKMFLDAEWLSSYIEAFSLMDKPKPALILSAKQVQREPDNFYFVNRYANLLSELAYHKTSYQVRLANWHRMQRLIAKQPEQSDEFWTSYNELAVIFSPIETSYPLTLHLLRKNYPTGADALLSYALAHQQYQLAAYLLAYYYPDDVPAWAALRMALARYDQVQLQKMLASKAVVVLPPKDKVRAAAQIGHIAEAQTYAYQNATRAPFDAERYQEMVDLMLLTSNNFTAITEFEQFGNLQGPRAILKGKLYHDSIWSITPYLSVWDAQTNNVGNLASHSYLEKIAGATLTYEAKRQKVSLKVANHDSLFNSYMASIEDEYLLMNQLRLTGRLGYNQRSTLTVFMLIAGAQDEAFGSFNYQITPRDSLLGSLELDNYYLQDRTLLGSGIIYTGGYDHKLRFEYPDVDISLTGSIDRFNQLNRAITGRALVIFPPNVTINTEAFVPRNFWQVIGTFGFGNSVRESYTHDWRPYANFGVIYASTSGYGYDLDIGLATSVIGRDRFAIYYQEATSSQGQVQKNFIIGMSYLIYC